MIRLLLIPLAVTLVAADSSRIQPGSRPAFRPRGEAAVMRMDTKLRITSRAEYKSKFLFNAPQVMEVVIPDNNRPVRVRVNMQIAGKPLPVFWKESLKRIFDTFDRDKDGYLNKYEVEYAFTKVGIETLLKGNVLIPYQNNDPGPSLEKWDRDGDGRINFDEYYDEVAPALDMPFRFGENVNSNPERIALNYRLLQFLDANGDGVISDEEFAQVKERIAQFDKDGDDCLSENELPPLPTPKPKIGRVKPPSDVPPSMPMPAKAQGQQAPTPANVGSDFLEVNPEPLPLPAWFPMPADIEVTVNIGGERGTTDLKINKVRYGTAQMVKQDTMVVLMGTRRVSLHVKMYQSPPKLDGKEEIDFKPRRDERILESELGTHGQFFRFIFDHADFNGDGILTHTEWLKYLELQQIIALNRVDYHTRNGPPILFGLLDNNKDGRLTRVELARAKEVLRAFQPEGPINVKVMDVDATAIFGLVDDNTANINAMSRKFDEGLELVWFSKMDANKDGEVSLKEFLGTAEQFRAIDTNGDGFIDVDEAKAATAKWKKKK